MHRRAPILAGLLFLTGCGGTETDNPAAPPLPEVARSSLAYDTAPAVSAETQAAVLSDLNNFGLAALRGLAPSGENFVLSPVSGFLALTMTSAGAQGTTADEMKAVLYPSVPATEIHPAANWLGQRIRGYARSTVSTSEGDKKVEVNLANDDFVQKGFAIEKPFLDTLAVNYDCGVELVDYSEPEAARSLINNWVANETANRIEDLLPEGAVSTDTRLVLVDALRLYASWNMIFDAKSTEPGTFHGIAGDTTTDMMHGSVDANYATGTGWVAVDVPYYGGSLVFTAVMPDAGQFDTVRSTLDSAWFANLDAASSTPGEIALTLPKFKLTGPTVPWKQTLQALGMATLFDPTACNLAGINPTAGLYVDEVYQQAFLELTELGTEAAAATAVVMQRAALVTSVVLDRPFLFFLRERGGPVLFAGQITTLPAG
jgi:serpin B